MKPILEIEALKKYYGKSPNQTKALDGITFQVMPGEFLGIMGSSGSGKSTLLNCIAAVIQPGSGNIIMNGVPINTLKASALADYRGKEIGYLFQNFELIDNLTGYENILLPLSLHNVPEKDSAERISRSDVGRSEAENRGGESAYPDSRDNPCRRAYGRSGLKKRKNSYGKTGRFKS